MFGFALLTLNLFMGKLVRYPMSSTTRFYRYFYYYGTETPVAGGEA
jgi:hypothetical protein